MTRLFRTSWTIVVPVFLYLLAMAVAGCGGAGGGGSEGGSGGGGGGGGTGGGGGGGTGGGGTGGGGTGAGSGAIYFLSDKDGPLAVYKVNVDGTGVTQVSAQTDLGSPCVTWDGTQIAYEKWALYADVYRMNADGSGEAMLHQEDTDCQNPCLSPDGTSVIFVKQVFGVYQLFRKELAGGGLTQLTTDNDGCSWARYSPDGTKIAYATAQADTDIRIMNADGTGVVTLASGPELQECPTFDPTGATVVYAQNFGDLFSPNFQIMSVPAAGGSPTRLTTSTGDDYFPCYSEDGLYILFTRFIGDGRDIFRMPAAGGAASQVTNFQFFTGYLSAPKR